jgi:c-di-GMP-binding flagellar brake protein YcgR
VERAERTQRREYLRVPMAAEAEGMYLGRLPREGDDREPIEPVPLQMIVADLSAGGLRGRGTIPMQPGDELTLTLPLPRSEKNTAPSVNVRGRVVDLPDLPPPLNLRGRVVRLCESAARGITYEVGVAFIDVAREDRERIIRFAMEVQRDRRRRGMI